MIDTLYLLEEDSTDAVHFVGASKPAAITAVDYLQNSGASDVESITETITLYMTGTGAAMDAVKSSIEGMFAHARNLVERDITNTAVYLVGKNVSTDNAFRTKVLDGEVRWLRPPGLWHANSHGELRIRVTRLPYWESTVETTVQTANTYSGGKVNTITLDAVHDTTRDNSFFVDGADIPGDLETPVWLQIKNVKVGLTYNMGDILIAQNIFSDPSTRDRYADASDEDLVTYSTSGASASHIDGDYTYFSFTPTAGVEQEIAYWDLAVQSYKGNYVRILMVHADPSGIGLGWEHANLLEFQWRITTAQNDELARSEWFYLPGNRDLTDVYTVRLPPNRFPPNVAGIADLRAHLYTRSSDSVAKNWYLDAVYFLPIDGFNVFKRYGQGIALNYSLISDGYKDLHYVINATGDTYPSHTKQGALMKLYPGRDTRFYVFAADAVHDFIRVSDLFDVTLKCRARKRTL